MEDLAAETSGRLSVPLHRLFEIAVQIVSEKPFVVSFFERDNISYLASCLKHKKADKNQIQNFVTYSDFESLEYLIERFGRLSCGNNIANQSN